MGIKITIEIPEEFREHWEMDKFGESLDRIAIDVRNGLKSRRFTMAGNYEAELADMLKLAFSKAEVS